MIVAELVHHVAQIALDVDALDVDGEGHTTRERSRMRHGLEVTRGEQVHEQRIPAHPDLPGRRLDLRDEGLEIDRLDDRLAPLASNRAPEVTDPVVNRRPRHGRALY